MAEIPRHCYICDQLISHNFRSRRSIEKSLQILNLRVITGDNSDAVADFCPPCRTKLDDAAEIVEKFQEANKRWFDILQTDLKSALPKISPYDVRFVDPDEPMDTESVVSVKTEPPENPEDYYGEAPVDIIVEEIHVPQNQSRDLDRDNSDNASDDNNNDDEEEEQPKTKQIYFCEYCTETFKSKTTLSKHMFPCYLKYMCQRRIYVRPFICDFCVIGFMSKQSLLDHMRAKHIRTYAFPCRFCVKKFTSSGSRKYHELNIHTHLYRYKCKRCSEGRQTISEIHRHVISKHVFDDNMKEIKKCYKEVTLEELRAREEELTKKVICENCGAGFMSTTHLNSHIKKGCKTENSQLPWLASCKCDECGRFFTSPAHLQKHKDRNCRSMKEFQKAKPDLKCPKCDKVFKLQKYLDKHLPTHDMTSVPRNWKCSQCVNAYTSPYALKQHVLRVHEKVFSYFCRYCSKGFYQAGDRCSHERFKHTFEKPWKCKLCGFSCVARKDLRRHAYVHGIKDDEERFMNEVAEKVDYKPKVNKPDGNVALDFMIQ